MYVQKGWPNVYPYYYYMYFIIYNILVNDKVRLTDLVNIYLWHINLNYSFYDVRYGNKANTIYCLLVNDKKNAKTNEVYYFINDNVFKAIRQGITILNVKAYNDEDNFGYGLHMDDFDYLRPNDDNSYVDGYVDYGLTICNDYTKI